MKKVSLSLTGLNAEINRDELLAALADLYGKPASHFEPHCEHLFDLHTPYVHIRKIAAEEAEKHRQRLAAIGIETAVAEIEASSGLSLIPVAEKAAPTQECPSCNQATSDPEMCSECGVMIKKFLEQQAIDNTLRKKLDAAGRSGERIKEVRNAEDQRRKEAASRKKTTPAEPELIEEPDGNHFVVKVEDQSDKRVMYFAGLALIASVIGGSYLMMHVKEKRSLGEQYDYATIDENGDTNSNNITTVAAKSRSTPTVETGSFKEWNQRIAQVKKLQDSLDILNETTGMSSTMGGLLAETDDPFVRIIGTQHLVNLKAQNEDNFKLSTTADSGTSYTNVLTNNSTLIQSLSSANEQLFSYLNLAQLYTDLQQHELVDSTLAQAKLSAIKIAETEDVSNRIIAEVTSAEYFAKYDATEPMMNHYRRATALAEQIDSDSEDNKWAIPFIARRHARCRE